MADVSSRFSGIILPRSLPEGQTCDLCGDPATVRRQGETDSFGCEWLDHCEPHDRALMEFDVSFTWCIECSRSFPLAGDDDDSYLCHVCREHVVPSAVTDAEESIPAALASRESEATK